MKDVIKVTLREIAKVFMFTLLWGVPVYLFHVTGTGRFLFLFIVSVFETFSLFSHYEALERTDRFTLGFDPAKEEDNDGDEES